MDRYGFLAESVIPPREDLLKKIDTTHMHLDEVERASDMAIITHSLLTNIIGMMRRGDVTELVDGFILEGTLETLGEALEAPVASGDVSMRSTFETYAEGLEARYRGQGFVQSNVDALRVASHLLLEAHRSIFESEDIVAYYAVRSVQILNGLQKAHAIAASAQA